VFLPNQIFIKTHQNKFSQSLTLNLIQWQNATGFKKLLSHFYNPNIIFNRKKNKRTGDNFDLNPFSKSDENLFGLNTSFRNSLFYNRGKQKHSVTHTFYRIDKNATFSRFTRKFIGYTSNTIHSFDEKTWLFSFSTKFEEQH
jgi:hypothetical protein